MSDSSISRRQAIKQMAAAGAILTSSSILVDAAGISNSNDSFQSTQSGTKVSSKEWKSLGDTISLLGLGCMRLPQKGGKIDQEQTNKMVDYALEHGINYFDTAPVYSGSEEAMGIALSRHDRKSYLLATKLSNQMSAKTLDAGKKMFESSLTKLKTDYVDYLLLHSLSDVNSLKQRFIDNGLLDYLLSLKKKGTIRHLGFSFHGSNNALKGILDQKYTWDFVQIQMNYADWDDMKARWGASSEKTDSKTLYSLLHERNIPIVVMEPIKGGSLANVNDNLKNLMAQRKPELSPAGMALSFVASHPGIMCTLSGMSNMAQLMENTKLFTGFKAFSQADQDFMLTIAAMYNSKNRIPCTSCKYCMPCPNGVNIPGNFSVYNKTSDENNLPNPRGTKDSDFNKKKKVLLTRYEKELSKGERADACTKCNVCLSKCPQAIHIPTQLQMIKDLVDAVSK